MGVDYDFVDGVDVFGVFDEYFVMVVFVVSLCYWVSLLCGNVCVID